ncbi:hypothetical protein CY34DRAFT_15800 [Suillus luteus UH-Slu-Lm8-n1]|uniref:DUF6533 domain-containing protein n=1 Tax=Suillus luteus UH-Slu-Lm8-n1 TaxID=930992 RepID=A0A0C9ZIS5_9AGAM|nr:hypothetical protein CY34DRAFT_15800 [Suillus luteus UH-Slu-Lm8-n1]
MTVVSNDPANLPFITTVSFLDNLHVVCASVVVYDWVLTFGQEVELIWMQRWSFMSVLYICVRYMGILYSVDLMLILLACTITSVTIMVMANIGVSAEEFILDGRRMCLYDPDAEQLDLSDESLISTAIWEILASALALWIVIKHFRELRTCATGSIIGDCFAVLIKSHAFYFVAFTVVACFSLGSMSPYVTYSSTVGSLLYQIVLSIFQTLQMFVLGPRLILSLREYHAKLVARSDEGTGMTSIYFQAGGDALAGGEV